MFGLSIGEFEEIVGAQVRMGCLPPLAGRFEPTRRVVLDSRDVEPGDVYWAVSGTRYRGEHWVEAAYSRGALGAVTSGRRVEPWAGKFALEVADANRDLCRLARCLAKSNLACEWLYVSDGDCRALRRALVRRDLGPLEELTERMVRRCHLAAA